jgi:hypothetical protein
MTAGFDTPSPYGDPPPVDYDTLPGLRWTHLARMRRSPKHYREYVAPRTPAMTLGTALHAMVSGEHKVCAYPGPVRRGKEWDAFQRAHASDIILTKRELDLVERMGGALLKHSEASSILARVTEREHVLQWERGGRLCKCKLDARGEGLLVEIKSTRDVSDRAFGRQIAQLGYVHQAAYYHSGWVAEWGSHPEHVVLAVENCSPFDVRVDDVPHELVMVADREIDRLLTRLRECEERDEWPGLRPGRGSIGEIIPDWWISDDEVSSITLDGEAIET